ncbi:MAG: hypothetical protein O7D30_04925 [Rickettsia endosymbiont of Ixodes persulcatus]|nr:hypothetical protein [Rickettsia endosymbiont of Ixodes persulcatus]
MFTVDFLRAHFQTGIFHHQSEQNETQNTDVKQVNVHKNEKLKNKTVGDQNFYAEDGKKTRGTKNTIKLKAEQYQNRNWRRAKGVCVSARMP